MMTLCLTPQKARRTGTACTELLRTALPSIRTVAHMVGSLVAAFPGVQYMDLCFTDRLNLIENWLWRPTKGTLMVTCSLHRGQKMICTGARTMIPTVATPYPGESWRHFKIRYLYNSGGGGVLDPDWLEAGGLKTNQNTTWNGSQPSSPYNLSVPRWRVNMWDSWWTMLLQWPMSKLLQWPMSITWEAVDPFTVMNLHGLFYLAVVQRQKFVVERSTYSWAL